MTKPHSSNSPPETLQLVYTPAWVPLAAVYQTAEQHIYQMLLILPQEAWKPQIAASGLKVSSRIRQQHQHGDPTVWLWSALQLQLFWPPPPSSHATTDTSCNLLIQLNCFDWALLQCVLQSVAYLNVLSYCRQCTGGSSFQVFDEMLWVTSVNWGYLWISQISFDSLSVMFSNPQNHSGLSPQQRIPSTWG